MEPYRIFFPLGVFAALLGTVFWVAFGFGLPVMYPGLYHADLMIGGFLFVFEAGFLMTAVPQFTGSPHCGRSELGVALALFLSLLVTGFLPERVLFHLLSAASLGFLVIYCGRRFVLKTYSPPRFFVFVGLGLLLGILGALMSALADAGRLTGTAALFGKLIYTQGTTLALIIGVGTHLLPAIWGWADLPIQITKLDVPEPSRWRVVGPVVALAAVLLTSFGLEAASHPELGRGLRAALVAVLAVKYWRLLRKPRTRGRLAFWLWISAWSLVIGLWLPVAVPAYAVHGLHVAFIGGFGLMTFMVASRVTLAHGGYGVRLEVRSRGLTAAALLVLIAALTRAAAYVVPHAYLHHLAYAALTWLVAVIVWAAVFLPRMVHLKEAGGEHC